MTAERRFRVMGTDVHVLIAGPERLADRAEQRLGDLERRWSRFRSDSEISRLNAAPGRTTRVSGDTTLLLRRAVEAWYLTAGLVDCCRLDALVAAGYDRSFDRLASRPDRHLHPAGGAAGPLGTGVPADLLIDDDAVTLPIGMAVDAGGIGKGLAADLVGAELLDAGAEGACINVGGDLRVCGVGPDDGGWTLSIDHPRHGPIAVIGLHDGAVASSTTLRRAWRNGGTTAHHLIDPRTDRPSTSPVAFAAAITADGWQAEAMAKAVLLGGDPAPPCGPGVAETVTVDHDGRVRRSDGFTAYSGGIEPCIGADPGAAA